ncbi:hypothetical protein C8R43DRAFT_950100 [Mycena crocata]|nr:hypothetical protein C8R43DRAFT_950100 [Mycena crocata]
MRPSAMGILVCTGGLAPAATSGTGYFLDNTKVENGSVTVIPHDVDNSSELQMDMNFTMDGTADGDASGIYLFFAGDGSIDGSSEFILDDRSVGNFSLVESYTGDASHFSNNVIRLCNRQLRRSRLFLCGREECWPFLHGANCYPTPGASVQHTEEGCRGSNCGGLRGRDFRSPHLFGRPTLSGCPTPTTYVDTIYDAVTAAGSSFADSRP